MWCSEINKTGTFTRFAISGFLLLLLVGCGNDRGLSPKSVPTSSPVSIGFDVAGLLHVEPKPVRCVSPGFEFSEFGSLVLSDNHSGTYDSNELQQIEKYVQDEYMGKATDPLPAALDIVPGGPECDSGLTITNISRATLQLQSMNMRLIAASKPNSRHYRLIDVCPLLPASERADCPGARGQGGGVEYSSFGFKPSPRGTIFSGTVSHSPQRSEKAITLRPSDVVYVGLDFTPESASNTYIYNVVPIMVINAGIYELKAAIMELVFANENQFSCYQLDKNTFVPLSPIPNYEPHSGHWCA